MTGFEAKDLCAGYGRREVLHEVSFSLVPDTVTAITGLNGSGKSTLLKCMANLLKPFSGGCFIDGVSLRHFKPSSLAHKIAFCAQRHPDCGYLSVRELVGMGRFSYRESRSATRAAAERAMELAGVRQFADVRMAELSPGVQQRVWIGISLAQQPDLLLLDEPSNFLDPAGKYALAELLKELRDSEKITIVFVTHDLELVLRSSDSIIALKDGKILKCGDTACTLDAGAVKDIYGIDYQPVTLR